MKSLKALAPGFASLHPAKNQRDVDQLRLLTTKSTKELAVSDLFPPDKVLLDTQRKQSAPPRRR
jgi:hypothetical protein